MHPYVIFTITVAVLVIAGVIRRTRRSGRGNALAQLAGGLNVFAAALLAFMTFALLVTLRLGAEFMVGSSLAFVIVICLYWVFLGLVPIEIIPGSIGKLLLGHFLLIVGTMAYGSVTFFIPFLVWLGVLSNEASASLPWLAFLTFPAALVVWTIGLALIWKSDSSNLLKGSHEH